MVFRYLENNFIAINLRDNSLFICGYIIDEESRFPLEAVTIIGNTNQTITDAFGYFKIKVTNLRESVIISHLGYRSLSKLALSFERNNCSNIFLSPQIETLSEVLLKNFITSGINKVVDGTFNINFSNFGIVPGLIETDVLQTVQALPGIQSTNETVSDINIRGGTNDQNLILWDGIKMYQSGHFFGLISIFSPLITKEATVIKNGTDVDLSNGVSGTIAMKTDTNINDTFKGNIGSNFINVDGFVDVPIMENSSLQLSARKAISDLVETPTYKEYFKRIRQDTEIVNNATNNVKFDFYDASVRWLYDITDKDQLRVNLLYVNNELVFNEEANQESRESSIKQTSYAGGIFYKRIWSPNLVSTFQGYETDYILDASNSDILGQQRLNQENRVSETSLKLNTWYKYNEQLSLLTGYEFIETGITNLTDIDNPLIIDEKVKVIREHAGYTQVNYRSDSKKTNAKVGVRYNFNEKFRTHIVEPRLSINHKLLDYLSLEILGEFKHQNTSQVIISQTDFLGIEKRRWSLSDNEDIPVAKSKQISLGLNFSQKGWLISAEAYYKKVNGITSLSQGFLNQHAFKKVNGSYQVYGMDFLINKRIKKVSTWLSYSYANNKYNFAGLEEINFPNNLDIRHSVTFGSSFSIDNFKISAGFNWYSGKPTTDPVTSGNLITNDRINYQEANSNRLNDYIRVDASATYKFKLNDKINANAGISVWNIWSRENEILNFYRINDSSVEQVSQNALSLTPNLTFRVEFR